MDPRISMCFFSLRDSFIAYGGTNRTCKIFNDVQVFYQGSWSKCDTKKVSKEFHLTRKNSTCVDLKNGYSLIYGG